MKKLYIILVLVVCQLAARAQPYQSMLHPSDNNWYYTTSIIPVRVASSNLPDCTYPSWNFMSSNYMSSAGDTTFNGYTYLQLENREQTNPTSDCFFGFLREDNVAKKVYFVDNQFGSEKLLYDFSMLPGDSIYLDFLQQGIFETGYFTLDSIGVVTIMAGPRRSFYLSNHSQAWSQSSLQWIEGVGYPGHLIYTHSANMFGGLFMGICQDGIFRDFYQQLTCFDHGATKIYFDSCMHAAAFNNFCFYYADSCYYFNVCGSLDENPLLGDVKIAPNPGSGKFVVSVEASRATGMKILVYNVQGKLLRSTNQMELPQGTSQVPLELSDLPSGIYISELKLKEGSVFRKIVLSKLTE